MAFSKTYLDTMARLLGYPEEQASGSGDWIVNNEKNRCCGHSKSSHGDVGCMGIVVNPESLDEVFCCCMKYDGSDHA